MNEELCEVVERKGECVTHGNLSPYPVGCTGTAAQRSACPVELAGLDVSIAMQTMTCSIEQQSAPELISDGKMALAKLYFPYLVPCMHWSLRRWTGRVEYWDGRGAKLVQEIRKMM
jgi:hypothetical protein